MHLPIEMRPETTEPTIHSERDPGSPIDASDACTTMKLQEATGERRRGSIRLRLASLVLACVLPVWIAAGYLVYHNYQSKRALTEQRMLETARALTIVVDWELATTQASLSVLATTPSLISGDLPAFYSRARVILEARPGADIILSDATGQQLINTFLPYGAALPRRTAPDAVHHVYATASPFTSNVFKGAVTGRYLISVDAPVFHNGRVVYDLAMTVPVDRFSAVLLQQHLPPEWVGGIFDGNQVIVARTRFAGEFVGRTAAPLLVRRIKDAAEGTVEAISLEGVPLINCFSRSAASGWTVSIGVPKASSWQRLGAGCGGLSPAQLCCR